MESDHCSYWWKYQHFYYSVETTKAQNNMKGDDECPGYGDCTEIHCENPNIVFCIKFDVFLNMLLKFEVIWTRTGRVIRLQNN